MNIFQEVKQSVTAKQAAEQYGIKVGRNGMACCPFHNDKHPSMKIDKGYYCFACGAKGDVINFVGELYGLTPYETAKKLAEDYGILLSEGQKDFICSKKKEKKPKRTEYQLQQEMEKWIQHCIVVLSDYRHLLINWRVSYAPLGMEEWHPRFTEAMDQLEIVEYHLDILLEGDLEEQLQFILDEGEKVTEIEKRINQYKSEGATDGTGGCGKNGTTA